MLVTAAIYFGSSVAFMVHINTFQDRWSHWGYRLLLAGVGSHVIAVAHLFLLHEGQTFVYPEIFAAGLGTVFILLIAERRLKGRMWASLLSPLATAIVIASLTARPDEEAGVLPEFLEFVTPLHIAASVAGFLFFLLSFGCSVLYIAQEHALKKEPSLVSSLPPQMVLTRLSLRGLKWGFPLYSLGIVLGAVWAFKGNPPVFSGRYVIAVLSWLVYGFVILGTVTTGWSGKKSATMTMVGFLAVLSVIVGYFGRWGHA